jgi:hypothetical protein
LETLELENQRLREENEMLKLQLLGKRETARDKITAIIANRVLELVPSCTNNYRATLKRKLTDDLKWTLRVRYANQFTDDHLEPALQFIQTWKLETE